MGQQPPDDPACFAAVKADMLAHTADGTVHAEDLYAAADPAPRLNVGVITEPAWHALFIRHLLRRPSASELAGYILDFTIIN